jgi:pyruvate dehydrogenase E2 component (dihydrolipoamide acetyltransferase)
VAITEITVPDIGDFENIPVIEIHVSVGDVVDENDPLITLESDKATMDVPAPSAGRVDSLLVALGDRVSVGSPIVVLEAGEGTSSQPPTLVEQQEPTPEPAQGTTGPAPGTTAANVQALSATPVSSGTTGAVPDFAGVHGGPGVRRLARELGVDLATVTGTGPKGRITKEDLVATLAAGTPNGQTAAPGSGAARLSGIPEIPAQDFARFGPIETRLLSRIKKLSGPHLHRSWLNVPHVTHNDEADITDLDAFRRDLDAAAKAEGYRVTLLAFLLKASVSALKAFPEVNSSLSPDSDALILKGYYHIGVAVDTPEGLVVPVIRDVDRKGVTELSRELASVSAKARDGKLTVSDLSGGTFTISSLGGIGGTSFTPIVNAPEAAILGVVRARTAPVWDGQAFVPRLMLPISLSYDHRVVDGALAARFARHLCQILEDLRRLVL